MQLLDDLVGLVQNNYC